MKINIASPGRFHVMDLARELDKHGYDVRFYSFVRNKRAAKFGLRKKCNASLFPLMFPFLVVSKLMKCRFTQQLTIRVQDFLTGILMRRCDVFIAMSGNYVYALKRAKRQGAIVVLERGSKHILEQKRILESIPSLKGKKPIPDVNVRRELVGYEIADYISIASKHVKRSFEERSYPADKLFVNPYGVDLSMFTSNRAIVKKHDVLMVGSWCYRKGCDLIIKAMKRTHYTLLHVGSLVDMEFPDDKQFIHVSSMDQSKLIDYYNQAKVLILPSREEGMSLVQMQAIACGLPVVCSMHTGGRDIGEVTKMDDWIFEMKECSADSLKEEIRNALLFAKTCDPDQLNLDHLSWEAYGKRYSEFIARITLN